MSPPFVPAQRLAVVTGGGSGIGRAVAGLLVARGARHVVLLDVREASAQQAADEINASAGEIRASGLRLDVSDESAMRDTVALIEERHGPIELFCSNAGIHRGRGLGDLADWRATLDVNLIGHVNAARHVIPRMIENGGGHFVITASAAGLLTDLRSAPYAASKHAAVALAEWLAIAHEADGVSVLCACPEGVKTAMTAPDSSKASANLAFAEPASAAEDILAGLQRGAFLILPHPRVAEFALRRASDRDRWLNGMRRARERITTD